MSSNLDWTGNPVLQLATFKKQSFCSSHHQPMCVQFTLTLTLTQHHASGCCIITCLLVCVMMLACSGGIPTEDLIQTAIDNAMWLCPATSLVISKNITIFNDPRAFVSCPATPPALAGGTGGWVPLKDLLQPNGILLPAIRNQLLQDWSIYNYQPKPNETNADHFFVTFEKFGWVKVRSQCIAVDAAQQSRRESPEACLTH